MKLDGMHHITMITGDAPRNVEFYGAVLGLRLVKKTVNFDAPEAYHLYFGDEQGSPGSILTWFEFAGARPGRAGAGMIHTIQLGVPSADSLEFWQQRLDRRGYSSERTDAPSLRFADYDGLRLELVVANAGQPEVAGDPSGGPRAARDHSASRALARYPGRALDADARLLTETLGFTTTEEQGGYRLTGPTRMFNWGYDPTRPTGDSGRRHRPPHRLAFDRRRSRAVAGSGSRRRGCR